MSVGTVSMKASSNIPLWSFLHHYLYLGYSPLLVMTSPLRVSWCPKHVMPFQGWWSRQERSCQTWNHGGWFLGSLARWWPGDEKSPILKGGFNENIKSIIIRTMMALDKTWWLLNSMLGFPMFSCGGLMGDTMGTLTQELKGVPTWMNCMELILECVCAHVTFVTFKNSLYFNNIFGCWPE